MTERTPGNFAILPGFVRFDRDLRPSAKLLYAEITALENYTGFCWATNRYLSALLGLSINTVSELVRQLADKEYISVEITKDEKGAIIGRRIRTQSPIREVIAPLPEEEDPGTEIPPEESGYPYPEKSGYPIPKNRDVINDNNINLIYPPIAPQRGAGKKTEQTRRKRQEPKKVPDCMPEAFAAFWKAYPRGESKQAAIRAWDCLAPTREDLRAMASGLQRAKESALWKKGMGIPYAATWLNQRRWLDETDKLPPESLTAPDEGGYWTDDPEAL